MKKLSRNKKSLIILLLAIYSIIVSYGYFDQKRQQAWSNSDIEGITLTSMACYNLKDKEFLKEKLSKYSKKELSKKLLEASFSANANLPIAMIELGAQIGEDYIEKLIALHTISPSLTPLKQIINYLVLELDYELSYEQKHSINTAITQGLNIGGSIVAVPESQIIYLTKILKLKEVHAK